MSANIYELLSDETHSKPKVHEPGPGKPDKSEQRRSVPRQPAPHADGHAHGQQQQRQRVDDRARRGGRGGHFADGHQHTYTWDSDGSGQQRGGRGGGRGRGRGRGFYPQASDGVHRAYDRQDGRGKRMHARTCRRACASTFCVHALTMSMAMLCYTYAAAVGAHYKHPPGHQRKNGAVGEVSESAYHGGSTTDFAQANAAAVDEAQDHPETEQAIADIAAQRVGVVEEEEDKSLTYDQFLKQQQSKAVAEDANRRMRTVTENKDNDKFKGVPLRRADEGDNKEEARGGAGEGKKKGKNKISLDEFVGAARSPPANNRGDRDYSSGGYGGGRGGYDNRGGRGGYGGRGGGRGGYHASEQDFPKLG